MRRLFAFFLVPLLFGGGVLLVHAPSFGDGTHGVSAHPKTPSPTTSPASCKSSEALASELEKDGFAESDYLIGDTVNWVNNPRDHVIDGFSSTTLDSRQKLSRFLRGTSDASRAAKRLLREAVSDAEPGRVVDTRGFLAVQFTEPVVYTGNMFWRDGDVQAGGARRVAAHDIWWVYINTDCEVVPAASVRVDCGNVGFDSLRPARKD